jgi:hypothetical protein
MQSLQHGRKYAWGIMRMVRSAHNNYFLKICHSHFVSCEGIFILWGLCILFFQKSKQHVWFLNALCGNCRFDYESRPLCKMCGCCVGYFKVGICLWDVIVGAGLLYYMGRTSRGRDSIPLEEIMFMCVCLSISYTLKCIAKMLSLYSSWLQNCAYCHTLSSQIYYHSQTLKPNFLLAQNTIAKFVILNSSARANTAIHWKKP